MSEMTCEILRRIQAACNHGSVLASVVGLDAGLLADSINHGLALECITIPASEVVPEETTLWWGATEMPEGVVLWGVDPAAGEIWVEGTYPTMDDARDAAQASGQAIISAAR